jgi:hypothetical protein
LISWLLDNEKMARKFGKATFTVCRYEGLALWDTTYTWRGVDYVVYAGECGPGEIVPVPMEAKIVYRGRRVDFQGGSAMNASYYMTNEELQNCIIETSAMLKGYIPGEDPFKLLVKHLEKLITIQACRAEALTIGPEWSQQL